MWEKVGDQMISRVAVMVLRLCALVAIVLGLLFWTGNALQLRGLHLLAGILLVLALWTIAVAGVREPGGAVRVVVALVIGVALAVVGLTQEQLLPGSAHWIIQVVHVALALAAIGLGEAFAARSAKARKAAPVAATR